MRRSRRPRTFTASAVLLTAAARLRLPRVLTPALALALTLALVLLITAVDARVYALNITANASDVCPFFPPYPSPSSVPASAPAAPPAPTATAHILPFYILSLEWAFTACARNPQPPTQICRSPPPAFTVCGLWPVQLFSAGRETHTHTPTCCLGRRDDGGGGGAPRRHHQRRRLHLAEFPDEIDGDNDNDNDAYDGDGAYNDHNDDENENENENDNAHSFTLLSILDLTPALRRFWPDLTPVASDIAQWRAQWLRHGTCTPLSQRTYFRKVLQLVRQYDFVRAFHAAGIIASGQRFHAVAAVQLAANAVVGGKRVGLRCVSTATRGMQLLDALHICARGGSFEVMDCPSDATMSSAGFPAPEEETSAMWSSYGMSNGSRHAPSARRRVTVPCEADAQVMIPYGSGDPFAWNLLPSGDGDGGAGSSGLVPRLFPMQLVVAVVYILVAVVAIALVAAFMLYHCVYRTMGNADRPGAFDRIGSYQPISSVGND